MIPTATPFLWEQMYQAPLHERLGPAPDVLIDFLTQTQHLGSAAPAMPEASAGAEVQSALADLSPALLHALRSRLLGVFFVDGLMTPVRAELLADPENEPVGAVLLVDAAAVKTGGAWRAALHAALESARGSWLADDAAPFPRRAQRSAATQACLDLVMQPGAPFLGLAPFARLSAASGDMRAVAQALLELAQQEADNPGLWMNLSTAFFAMDRADLGLAMQSQALAVQRLYPLPAARQPASLRLLLLMAEGDLAENTPLDCLLEDSDVDITLYYATTDAPLPLDLPEHDLLMAGISDTVANRPLLAALTPLLTAWPKPVINAPQHIPNTERSAASALLADAPGIAMPPTREVARAALQDLAQQPELLAGLFDGCAFPLILRPVGSHAGRDLARIADAGELSSYLERVLEARFYVSRFIDYSGADGLYRKLRIALINGQPHVCHMAISSHWMIHYVNAGMYEDAAKRAEEAAFMADFDAFATRHRAALEAIHRRSRLDYVCIDCAETRDGQLLIFEIDHAMVAHAMDPAELFPYKQPQMHKVKAAFLRYLQSRHARHARGVRAYAA